MAVELASRLTKARLIPILKAIEEPKIIPDNAEVAVVFPIYITSLPIPVRKFAEKLDASKLKYLVGLTTHSGYPGRVGEYLDKLLKDQGRALDAYFDFKMPGNNATGLMPRLMFQKDWEKQLTAKAVRKLEQQMIEDLDEAVELIRGRANNMDQVHLHRGNMLKRMSENITDKVATHSSENMKPNIAYYADDTCNGCGLCERVCPTGQVEMDAGKPRWNKEKPCYACYGCYNHCPEMAIHVKGYEQKSSGTIIQALLSRISFGRENRI